MYKKTNTIIGGKEDEKLAIMLCTNNFLHRFNPRNLFAPVVVLAYKSGDKKQIAIVKQCMINFQPAFDHLKRIMH
jgi:hypothetical protein